MIFFLVYETAHIKTFYNETRLQLPTERNICCHKKTSFNYLRKQKPSLSREEERNNTNKEKPEHNNMHM